jgi:hypothetical protein
MHTEPFPQLLVLGFDAGESGDGSIALFIGIRGLKMRG